MEFPVTYEYKQSISPSGMAAITWGTVDNVIKISLWDPRTMEMKLTIESSMNERIADIMARFPVKLTCDVRVVWRPVVNGQPDMCAIVFIGIESEPNIQVANLETILWENLEVQRENGVYSYLSHPLVGDQASNFDTISGTPDTIRNEQFFEWTNNGYVSIGGIVRDTMNFVAL